MKDEHIAIPYLRRILCEKECSLSYQKERLPSLLKEARETEKSIERYSEIIKELKEAIKKLAY